MFKYIQFSKVETEHTVLEFRGGDELVKVNHFDKDVVSIEADSEADIDALIAQQANEIACEVITQDEFKAIAQTTSQYARIKTIVDEEYTNQVTLLTKQYPAVERETWTIQLEQAKAFKASLLDTDAPFLKTLADAEGDTVMSFADAVVAKALEYETFMAQKLVEKRAHERSLMGKIGL